MQSFIITYLLQQICVVHRPVGMGAFGAMPQIFLCPPNCVVPRKICFKHIMKTKILPSKNIFCPTKP